MTAQHALADFNAEAWLALGLFVCLRLALWPPPGALGTWERVKLACVCLGLLVTMIALTHA